MRHSVDLAADSKRMTTAARFRRRCSAGRIAVNQYSSPRATSGRSTPAEPTAFVCAGAAARAETEVAGWARKTRGRRLADSRRYVERVARCLSDDTTSGADRRRREPVVQMVESGGAGVRGRRRGVLEQAGSPPFPEFPSGESRGQCRRERRRSAHGRPDHRDRRSRPSGPFRSARLSRGHRPDASEADLFVLPSRP